MPSCVDSATVGGGFWASQSMVGGGSARHPPQYVHECLQEATRFAAARFRTDRVPVRSDKGFALGRRVVEGATISPVIGAINGLPPDMR